MKKFILKNKIFVVAVIVLSAVFLGLFQFHLGYDYGPYKVQDKDNLWQIMSEATGSRAVGFMAVKSLASEIKVNDIWKNSDVEVTNGDIVVVKGNQLTIVKPNKKKLTAKIFSEESYLVRKQQVVAYDLILFVLLISIIFVIYEFFVLKENVITKAKDDKVIKDFLWMMKSFNFVGYGFIAVVFLGLIQRGFVKGFGSFLLISFEVLAVILIGKYIVWPRWKEIIKKQLIPNWLGYVLTLTLFSFGFAGFLSLFVSITSSSFLSVVIFNFYGMLVTLFLLLMLIFNLATLVRFRKKKYLIVLLIINILVLLGYLGLSFLLQG